MNKEFVMRGQTASGKTEILNFSGHKPGYAYRLVEFKMFPSTNINGDHYDMVGSITAGKTAVAPTDPDFNNEGLIATGFIENDHAKHYPHSESYVINDMFLITQNLILMVQDTHNTATNWQCKFVAEKMSKAEEAVNNYKQYTISDE